MTQEFNTSWKSSIQPRKQRKYRFNAPNHIRSRFMRGHLSKALIEKYHKRSARIRKGDKVKVMRGQFKGQSGIVERVDVGNEKIYVDKLTVEKKDGSKSMYPVHPSNVMITDLKLDDKKRAELLKRK